VTEAANVALVITLAAAALTCGRSRSLPIYRFNAWLAVFAEITDNLRDYLHSALASREAMSAVPKICRRGCAKISRRSSADQIGKLCRFGFRPQATKVSARAAVVRRTNECRVQSAGAKGS